jgi:hypothetical protein
MSRTNKKSQQDLLWTSAFHLIDTFVELYLSSVIKPFVSLHEVFYSGLNNVLRKCLDDNQSRIPAWFTANFITYFRTALVLPTAGLASSSVASLDCDFGGFWRLFGRCCCSLLGRCSQEK